MTDTSPTYYGMRTYVKDLWLRMWFLGGAEEVDAATLKAAVAALADGRLR